MGDLVDMAKTPEDLKEDRAEMSMPISDYPQNLYPYGLCISLCEEELAKLDLSSDVNTDDLIAVRAIGKVTSVSKTATDQGQKMRVEIQLMMLALDEDHEDADPAPRTIGYSKFYSA